MQIRSAPEELGRELRQGHSPFLKRRRGIVGLSFFSCAVLGAVALYQIGILKKLPEPRWRGFNTGKVNGSGEAYSVLGAPDAFLGLASYAVTACLAAMGPEDRFRTHPSMPIAMGLKLLIDSAMAGKLTLGRMPEVSRILALVHSDRSGNLGSASARSSGSRSGASPGEAQTRRITLNPW